ncbi:Cyclic nucleotide-binding domain-containing protein [Desulfocicer vacuolatum DSM 3385]|uniref:Cyclic nucleotide-binding domain-containing protein n=1 Tax=Desulfocicer vacuolatum DSM 3385 TaxID=1121400 RepID=A0A1W2CJV1_9BACT|nr:cyclic nucleotide-binding domain-containing protein [Desulfocicer vacuolatum]SMC85471.1 Cyclic nucleotide-binding domain-containing protein [Desulfocicer vacuolatum DSM 3385]
MYLTQGDLFWGMDADFVKDVMNQTEKMDFEDGTTIFNQDEAADFFYVLIKGRIKLSIGTQGPVVFMAKDAGMVIGWSSLVGRETYSATALCVSEVKVVKIEKNSFLEKLAKYPSSESLLYKRLAQMLGDRLITLYPSLA